MVGSNRNYFTGRFVCVVLELVGWLIIALGLTVAIWGWLNSGPVGSLTNYISEDIPVAARFVAVSIGILTVSSGLLAVMSAQHTKATIDTALLTQKLLALEIEKRDKGK